SPIGKALNQAVQALAEACPDGQIPLSRQDASDTNPVATAFLQQYIAQVVQSLQCEGGALPGCGLPPETWNTIKMMDLELVKWAMENPQLTTRDINLARSNLVVNFLFTRGLGVMVKKMENP